jgi:hypothetical protein
MEQEYFVSVSGELRPATAEERADMEAMVAEHAVLEAQMALDMARANRRAAFTEEADPLFFKAHRGEATLEEWQAKVAEIRLRFPDPS